MYWIGSRKAWVFWSKLTKLWNFETSLSEKIVFLSKLLKLWNFELLQIISKTKSSREIFIEASLSSYETLKKAGYSVD